MAHRYCDELDVGMRLGLNNAQRQQANTKIEIQIRRASIEIDQEFLYYGRTTPSDHIAENTLLEDIEAGATSITLSTAATDFSESGKGNIDGDSFQWTGKSGASLTGCTGISFAHHANAKVQEGEMAHVLREICADISAALYMEDESTFQRTDEGLRATAIRERATEQLRRLAHLGKVI